CCGSRRDVRACRGRRSSDLADLGGQRVAAIAERDAGAPVAVALDDGAADLGGAIEDDDGGAGIGDIDGAGNGLARLVDRAAGAADRNGRRSGVEREAQRGLAGVAEAMRMTRLDGGHVDVSYAVVG